MPVLWIKEQTDSLITQQRENKSQTDLLGPEWKDFVNNLRPVSLNRVCFNYIFVWFIESLSLKVISFHASQEPSGRADMADARWNLRSRDLALLTFLLLVILLPEARYSPDCMSLTPPPLTFYSTPFICSGRFSYVRRSGIIDAKYPNLDRLDLVFPFAPPTVWCHNGNTGCRVSCDAVQIALKTLRGGKS